MNGSLANRTVVRASGFTMIEVMVGMALLSLLVISVMNLFGTVGEEFSLLTLRQKAVLVANGEMERLNALYNYGDFQRELEASLHRDSANLNASPNPLRRWIYRAQPHGVVCPGTDPAAGTFNEGCFLDTKTSNGAVNLNDFPDGRILFMDTTSGSNVGTEWNVVWIDRERNVTGRLDWTLTAGGIDQGAGACPNCRFLTLTLRYPYRFQAGSNPAEESMGTPQSIVLRTIVGDFLNAGLVTYLPFEGGGLTNSADTAGESPDSTSSGGGDASDRAGRADSRSWEFAGTDALEIADDGTLDVNGTDSFSISLWINTTTSGSEQTLVAKDVDNAGNPGGPGWRLGIDAGGNVTFIVDDGTTGTTATLSPGTALADGQWRHVVAVRDTTSDFLQIYLDQGSSSGGQTSGATTDTTTATLVNGNPVRIGLLNASSGQGFTGQIDDLRIYRRALTPSEIVALYELRR